MMKLHRAVKTLLVIVIACSCFSLPVLAVENSAAYTVDTRNASAGETVNIAVTLDNNIEGGFWGACFHVTYDKTYLTLNSMTPGSALEGISTLDGYGFYPVYNNLDYCNDDFATQITISGEVAILTFLVADDAPNGEYIITVDAATVGNPWFYDSVSGDLGITPTVTPGKIIVSSSDSKSEVLTVEDNFTNNSYFADAGITVIPAETDLSFTVACDNACVVAKDNGDGTYTRLTGVAVPSGYQFTADSASDSIVVLVKGDVNGDGMCNSADAAVASAYAVGSITRLTELQMLVLDINKDGLINSADSAVAKAVSVGNLTMPW